MTITIKEDQVRMISVSYTHLDVYKRQDEDPLGSQEKMERSTPITWSKLKQPKLKCDERNRRRHGCVYGHVYKKLM